MEDYHSLAGCALIGTGRLQCPSGLPLLTKQPGHPHRKCDAATNSQCAGNPHAHPQVAFVPGKVNMKDKLEPLPGVKAPKLKKVVKAKFQTTQRKSATWRSIQKRPPMPPSDSSN